MFGKKKNRQERPLNIIIVGFGKVGRSLIENLSKEDNNITLIEKQEDRLSDATNLYDIMPILGNGATYHSLKDAGVMDADLIIAVTESDELNLLCCSVATTMNPDCSAIARVRTPEYSAEVEYFRDKLGIAMIINPEREAARAISHIINVPSAMDINAFAHGGAEKVRYRLREGGALDGQVLHEFMSENNLPLLFCAVERDGGVMIPNGNFRFQAGDAVTFVSQRKDCIYCLSKLGVKTNPVKKCIIIGGGNTAYYLALHLHRAGIRVKIIENDAKRCRVLSDLLPHATIIHGDGTDISLLHEEGLVYADAIVTLTGIDEENILLSLHARHASNAKTITKISRFSFPEVLDELDMDSLIYPRLIIAETITAYVRAKRASGINNVETVYSLTGGAEAIELRITEESRATGTPLMDLELKDNLIIATIFRNGRIFFPSGTDTINVGDNVIIATSHTGFNDIDDILA